MWTQIDVQKSAVICHVVYQYWFLGIINGLIPAAENSVAEVSFATIP